MMIYDETLILDLVLATNEHPRRDTDVILRLSKATIEDLPFYIGFVKESMVKMIVYDETVAIV